MTKSTKEIMTSLATSSHPLPQSCSIYNYEQYRLISESNNKSASELPSFFTPFKSRTHIKSALIRPFYQFYKASFDVPQNVALAAVKLLAAVVDICLLDFPSAWRDSKSVVSCLCSAVTDTVKDLLLTLAATLAIGTRAVSTIVGGVVDGCMDVVRGLPPYFTSFQNRRDLEETLIKPFSSFSDACFDVPRNLVVAALSLLGTAIDICLLDFPAAWVDSKSVVSSLFSAVSDTVNDLLLTLAATLAIATRSVSTVFKGVGYAGTALSGCLFGDPTTKGTPDDLLEAEPEFRSVNS